MEGPVLPFVVGAFDDQLVALLADRDGAGKGTAERALGALYGDVLTIDGHVDPAGHGDGESSDTRHRVLAPHHTKHRISPPTLRLRASRSVISPWLVETMATPSPPSTRGT